MNTKDLGNVHMYARFAAFWMSLFLLVSPAAYGQTPATKQAPGQNGLEAISFTSAQGGKVLVKITLKQRLANPPPGFTVSNPPRIALDLPNTVNNLGKTMIEANEGELRNVTVVEAANRTRLVMTLAKTVTYDTRLDGNTVLITLQGPPVASSAAPTATSQFAEALPGVKRHSIRDLDFRRGPTGEGRVVIDLSDTGTGIDIRQQGKQLIVDFLDTTLPRNLERRLDVADFGTPIKQIDAFTHGGGVRLAVQPTGLWEHSAYQTDTQFILEVKPVKEDPNKLVQGTRTYGGEKLSLNFQNVEVRAVLQVIADFTGLNIITSDTVSGNLTLRLKDVPWDQALDIILQSKNLDKRKTGNVVLIAPRDELATREKLELESKQQISELEPLVTESFKLKYQKAEDLKKLFDESGGGAGSRKLLSKRGSAVLDSRSNTLFIQDVPSKLEEVRRLINEIDVSVRQVLIESRIVIADDKFSRQLGARFGNQSGHNSGDYNLGLSGNLDGSSLIAAGTKPTGGGNLNVNLPSKLPNSASLALTLLNLGSGNLVNVELSAMEADGRGKIVSSPRVITSDKQKAVIEQGTEIPYLQASSSGATNVSFKPAVLSLTVTPQITPDDKVIMDLEVKKDSVGLIYAGVPSIDTKKVITQILVDNGETAVLGGIYEQTIRNDEDKVPLLGDVPIIGHLFKRTMKQDDKTELLVFITPKIIKEGMATLR